jgi:hypothetical protein
MKNKIVFFYQIVISRLTLFDCRIDVEGKVHLALVFVGQKKQPEEKKKIRLYRIKAQFML